MLNAMMRRSGTRERRGLPPSQYVSAPAVFVFAICVAAGLAGTAVSNNPAPAVVGGLAGLYFLLAIKVAAQWEKVALLRLGRYVVQVERRRRPSPTRGRGRRWSRRESWIASGPDLSSSHPLRRPWRISDPQRHASVRPTFVFASAPSPTTRGSRPRAIDMTFNCKSKSFCVAVD